MKVNNMILKSLCLLVFIFQISEAKTEQSGIHLQAIEDWATANDFAITDNAVISIMDTYRAYSIGSDFDTNNRNNFNTYLTFHLTSNSTIPSFTEIFEIEENDNAMVLPRPNTSLLIISIDPSDAKLSVNNQDIGSNLRKVKVASGTYHVQAEKDGYRNCSVSGQVEAGERKSVECLLQVNE